MTPVKCDLMFTSVTSHETILFLHGLKKDYIEKRVVLLATNVDHFTQYLSIGILMKKSIAVLFLCLIASLPLRADFNDGVVAYLMGQYKKAYSTMRSLAESSDHAYAQYYVGMMHLNGQGVEQDYEEAGRWFRKASEQSIPQAQYKLGLLYMNGQGLPQDYEFAYSWFRVGATHGHNKSIQAIAGAREKLSDEELKEAEKLSAEYITKYGPKEETANKPIEVKNE